MARPSLIPQVRGSLHIMADGTPASFGDSRERRFPPLAVVAEAYIQANPHVCDGPVKCCQPDCSVCGISESASFERMMRNNRAVGF